MAALRVAREVSWTDKSSIALIVGGTAVLGASYWYYVHRHKRVTTKRDSLLDKESSKRVIKAAGDVPGKAEDNQIPDKPFQQALSHKDEGNKLFKSGGYEEAILCYEKAIELCPKERLHDVATFHQNKAAAHEQLKQYNKVIEDCSAALDLSPKYVKALLRRAKAYEVTNNLINSLEDLTAACMLEEFQNQTCLYSADRVLKTLGRQRAKEAMVHRELSLPSKYFVRTYFSSFSRDPLTFDDTVKETDTPESDLKGYACARQLYKEHKYDGIVAACTEEIETSGPAVDDALVLRGTFRLLTGDHTGAFADLNAVVEKEGVAAGLRANALIKRASLSMQLEKPEDSLEDFRLAALCDPENPDVYHHQGQVHLLMDKIPEAMAAFERAVQLNPTFPIAYVQKIYTDYRNAFATRDMEKLQNVLAAFGAAIEKFPTCCECYTLYAQVLSDQGDYDEADALFKKASEIEPENAAVFVHRAVVNLQSSGDFIKAEELIRTAIAIDDKCEFALETLGTLEVQQGNLESAVELFERAILLAKTELECAHLYSLRDASMIQARVAARLGFNVGGKNTAV